MRCQSQLVGIASSRAASLCESAASRCDLASQISAIFYFMSAALASTKSKATGTRKLPQTKPTKPSRNLEGSGAVNNSPPRGLLPHLLSATPDFLEPHHNNFGGATIITCDSAKLHTHTKTHTSPVFLIFLGRLTSAQLQLSSLRSCAQQLSRIASVFVALRIINIPLLPSFLPSYNSLRD